MITAEEIKRRQIAAGSYKPPKPTPAEPAYITDIMASASYKREQEARRKAARQLRGCTLQERLELKQWALEYKGGKCSICGYSRCPRALEFHHVSRYLKTFGISNFFNQVRFRSVEECKQRLEEELRKCTLLCANCHREVEAGYAEVGPAEGGPA